MKYLLAMVMVLISTCAFGMTASWDAPTTGGTPEGYILEWTDGTEVFTKTTTSLSITIEDKYFDMNKQYSFTVRAYNSAGQSEKSNTATWTRLPFVPPVDSVLVVKLDVPTMPGNAKVQ